MDGTKWIDAGAGGRGLESRIERAAGIGQDMGYGQGHGHLGMGVGAGAGASAGGHGTVKVGKGKAWGCAGRLEAQVARPSLEGRLQAI